MLHLTEKLKEITEEVQAEYDDIAKSRDYFKAQLEALRRGVADLVKENERLTAEVKQVLQMNHELGLQLARRGIVPE